MTRTVTALTIAGSGPSGGAGIQADLKAMSANGAYAMSATTAPAAQSTCGITGVHAMPLDFARLQLDTVLADIRPGATKIEMLATTELAALIAEYLPILKNTVFDPVVVATSDDPLPESDARAEVRRLCTLVELVTPDPPEVAVLLERGRARSVGEMIEQAKALRELGVKRALVKGGYLDKDASDVFVDEDGPLVLMGRRIATQDIYGTGCTLPLAIVALRPRRHTWIDVAEDTKTYLTETVAHTDSLGIGHGYDPIHHLHAVWSKEER